MNSKSKKQVMFICQAGLIAALYCVLTIVSAYFGLASYEIQVRLSEALTVLPLFTPAAIPGLTVGCIVSNLLTGASPLDVVFGSIATLLGAVIAYFIGTGARKTESVILKILVPFPNVLTNALIIPWVLKLVYHIEGPVWYFMLTVGAGELIAGVVLGLPLLFMLDKHKKHIFKI
ncbi:MAG: QueT transporter family protein [Ruminococcaceae bacterium]|nr:QueT transporter family protein [Oscillospiraceae bacterium]